MKKDTKYVIFFYGFLLLAAILGIFLGALLNNTNAGFLLTGFLWSMDGFFFGSRFYRMYVKEPGKKFWSSLSLTSMKAIAVPYTVGVTGLALTGIMLYKIFS
jgi:hypothetical protein